MSASIEQNVLRILAYGGETTDVKRAYGLTYSQTENLMKRVRTTYGGLNNVHAVAIGASRFIEPDQYQIQAMMVVMRVYDHVPSIDRDMLRAVAHGATFAQAAAASGQKISRLAQCTTWLRKETGAPTLAALFAALVWAGALEPVEPISTQLTGREQLLLLGITVGETAKEVAARRRPKVSSEQIDHERKAVMYKLNATSWYHAVAIAIARRELSTTGLEQAISRARSMELTAAQQLLLNYHANGATPEVASAASGYKSIVAHTTLLRQLRLAHDLQITCLAMFAALLWAGKIGVAE